jgi:hypothetical protein
MSIALGPLLTNLYPVKDGTDIEVDMSAGSEPEGPMYGFRLAALSGACFSRSERW